MLVQCGWKGKFSVRFLRSLVRRFRRRFSKRHVFKLLRNEAFSARTSDQTTGGSKKPLQPGIGVYGLFTAEIGIGQGGRRLADALKKAQIPLSLHNLVLPKQFESSVEYPTDR